MTAAAAAGKDFKLTPRNFLLRPPETAPAEESDDVIEAKLKAFFGAQTK